MKNKTLNQLLSKDSGQALTEYALLVVVTVFSMVVVNKLFIDVIGKALKRVIEIVSVPFP